MTLSLLADLFDGKQYQMVEHPDFMRRLHGRAWDEYRRAWDSGHDFQERSFPVHLDFELNHNCNLNCSFCYWSRKDFRSTASNMIFPLDKFKEILIDSVSDGLYSVNLENNNEPLMNFDLPKYVKLARQIGVLDVMLHTNGHLLTPSMAQQLIEAGLTRMFISVDAFSPASYMAMRGGGRQGYEKVVRNIHSLLELRSRLGGGLPLVTVSFLQSNVNRHETVEFKSFWERQVENVHIQMYQDFTSPELRTSHGGTLPSRCAQPMVRAAIRADGSVQPCCSFFGYERYNVGNLYQNTMYDIWNSTEYQTLRTLMRQGRLAENPICRQCIRTWDVASNDAKESL